MSDVSNVFDVRTLGLNDDAYDDPEDLDYEEEFIDEPEGKFHHPLPWSYWTQFSKIKFDQQLNLTFIICMVFYFENKINIFLWVSEYLIWY